MDAEQMARQMQERIPISAKDALDEFARLCAQPAQFEGRGAGDGAESGAEVRTRFARLLDENGYRAQMERYKARPHFIRWLTSGTRRKLEALRKQCFMAAVFDVAEDLLFLQGNGQKPVGVIVDGKKVDFLGQSPLSAAREEIEVDAMIGRPSIGRPLEIPGISAEAVQERIDELENQHGE